MPAKWVPSDLHYLIRRYERGESLTRLAQTEGISSAVIVRVLTEQNVPIRRPNKRWVPRNGAVVIERYVRGESVKSIASALGVSRATLTKWLQQQGVTLRTQTDANRTMAAARTPKQRAAYTEAAHNAVRGKRQSIEHRTRIARSRERNVTSASSSERLIGEWLSDLQPVPQKAVGPYNIDLAVGPVAVEVFGGHWHATGHHAARTTKRARYILNEDWTLVIVWVTNRHRLKPAVANYIRTVHEVARRGPSLRGQYRVIWGDGEDVTERCPDLDQLAVVPPTSPS